MYVAVTIAVLLRRVAIIVRAMKLEYRLIIFGGNKVVRVNGTIRAIVRDGFVSATGAAYAAIIVRGTAKVFGDRRRIAGHIVKFTRRLVRKITFYHAIMEMAFCFVFVM